MTAPPARSPARTHERLAFRWTPNWSLLRQVAEHDQVLELVADLRARQEPIHTIMPTIARTEAGEGFVFPANEAYGAWLAGLGAQR